MTEAAQAKMEISEDQDVEQLLGGTASQPQSPDKMQLEPQNARNDDSSGSISTGNDTTGTSLESAMQDIKPEPLSEYELICKEVTEDIYSSAKWNKLIAHAEASSDIQKIRDSYDWLLRVYPNTPAAQVAYLRHFTERLDKANQESAQALFKPFLRQSASPELFRFYLGYVSKVNKGRSNFQTTMKASYEFALGQCGHDKDAGIIWADFIDFIKSWEDAGPNDVATRINKLRETYQKAVQIPLENVEQLWREYSEWENAMHKQGAKAILSTVSQAVMTAKTKLRELREHLKIVMPPDSPPPVAGQRPLFDLPTPPVFSTPEKALRDKWLLYLQWEESNPLEFELQSEAGKKEFVSRMRGVYRKAAVRMRFYGEIWFRWFTWTSSLEKRPEDPMGILTQGVEADTLSFLLNFTLAEQYELQGKLAEAHSLYTNFLDKWAVELDKVEASIPPPPNAATTSTATIEAVNGTTSANNNPEKEPIRTLFNLRVKEVGQAWIMYYRFARRAEGFQSSRKVFAKARKAKHLDWRVYDFAASTEYHCTKDTGVAVRIYESGLTKYAAEVDFAVHYLTFLININDENNARALFERVITTFTPAQARPLWERWLFFEYNFTDLAGSIKLEKRLAEAYPEDPPTKRFAIRHKYYADAIATKDRGFITPENSAAQLIVRGGDSAQSALNTLNNQIHHTQQPPQSTNTSTPTPAATSAPRRSSPERRRREESPGSSRGGGRHDPHAPPYKRARPASPPPRDRDRDRYDVAPPVRRRGSPGWDRDKDYRDRERERERERDDAPSRRYEGAPIGLGLDGSSRDRPPSAVPSLVSGFLGTLPAAHSFDGPVFRTDDLMQVLRNATIPHIQPPSARNRSPPPRGRPPPDYGPYRGPGSSGVNQGRRW